MFSDEKSKSSLSTSWRSSSAAIASGPEASTDIFDLLEFLDNFHTASIWFYPELFRSDSHRFETDSRHSTRFTALTRCPPISPPVIVTHTSGASRVVVSAGFLDLVHTHLILHDSDYSVPCLQFLLVFWLCRRISLGILVVSPCSSLFLVIDRLFRRFQSFSLVSLDSLRFSVVLSTSVLDFSSLLPGFVEFIAPPVEILVTDEMFGEHLCLDLKFELLLIYGSLPRPPESWYASCSWRNIIDLVYVWPRLASGHLFVDDDIVVLRFLESRFAHRQGEKLKFAVVSCCLNLCEADCYGFLLLESLASEVDSVMLLNFGGLSMINPPDDAAVVPHFKIWFRFLTLAQQQAIASVVFLSIYRQRVADFTVSSACFKLLLFTVAESLVLLCGLYIWSDVLCDDLSSFLCIRHGLPALPRLLQKMEIMSKNCFILLVSTYEKNGLVISISCCYESLYGVFYYGDVPAVSLIHEYSSVYQLLIGDSALHLLADPRFLHLFVHCRKKVSAPSALTAIHEFLLKQILPPVFLRSEPRPFIHCTSVFRCFWSFWRCP